MSATENFADNKSLLLTVPALILTAVCSILPFGKAEAGACPGGSCMPGCAECSCEGSWQTCNRCFSSHARVKQSANQYVCVECGENERVSSDGSSCIPTKCADGYAIDPALGCVSCSTIDPSCTSCDTPTDCTGCAEGYAVSLNDDKCYACNANCSTCGYDDTNHKITECTACKNGFRFSSKNNGSCVAEVPNCATYNNKDKCQSCNEGYSLYGNGSCQIKCNSGYYRTNNNTCEQCDSSCKTCSSAEECTSCNDGDILKNGTCIPASTGCGVGYVLHNNLCYSCPSNCLTCGYDDGTYCTTCTTGYGVDSNGTCFKCGGHCERCGGSNMDCRVCESGYFLYNENGDPHCAKCPSGCAECSSADSCNTCADGLVKKEGVCVESCGEGYSAENGICVQNCPANCDSCTSADSCDTCSNGYLNEGGACVESCSSGSYADGNTCKACDSSCSTCSGSGTCDTCAEGLIKQGSSCVSGCDSGYYQDGDSCKACGDNCNVCDSAASCRTCASGFVEQQGKCRSKCDDGWTDMGGWCNRTSYSPNEAAPLLTNDNNNSFTIIFKK